MSFDQRLKALEQHVIETVSVTPAIVQIIHGVRTIEQQTEYDNAIANDIYVVAIGVKDCSKGAQP